MSYKSFISIKYAIDKEHADDTENYIYAYAFNKMYRIFWPEYDTDEKQNHIIRNELTKEENAKIVKSLIEKAYPNCVEIE